MPVTLFKVRWPDGSVETCYSPSTVIKDYVQVDRSYTLDEFVGLCRTGLTAASDRVGRLYGGGGCSNARAQLAAIEATVKRHAGVDAPVHVEGFEIR